MLNSRIVHTFGVFAALVIFACGCGGSPGHLANEKAEGLDHVKEKQLVYVRTDGGLSRVRIDGSERSQLFRAKYYLQAVSADEKVFVLGDSETNLYIRRGIDGPIERIEELDRRVGQVALSPDGATVAVTRHGDYDLPQSQWDETVDDRIYLIDTETLDIRTLRKKTDELVTSLAWSKDGDALWLTLFDHRTQKVDVETGERSFTEMPEGASTHWSGTALPKTCAKTGDKLVLRGWKGDEGIDIEAPDGSSERLVIVEGRERGFHDYLPTIDSVFFSESCRYVVFEFRRTIWVVDAKTGVAAELMDGHDAFAIKSR